MRIMVIQIVVDVLRKFPKGMEKREEELKISEIRDHPLHSIAKIGKNTEKTPGDLI